MEPYWNLQQQPVKRNLYSQTGLHINSSLDIFVYEQDHHVLKSPSPPPVPELEEQVMSDHFTVNQLFNLYKQVTLVVTYWRTCVFLPVKN